MYKLVSVDSLAVYCDEDLSPPSPDPVYNASVAGATGGSGSGSGIENVSPRAGSASPSSSSLSTPTGDVEVGGDGPTCSRSDRSFLATGLTDEDLEGMFRTSLAGGGDRHSYVVIPASPYFRLRVQRDGGSGGGGGVGGSSKYKVQAFFNEVGGWAGG